MNYLYFIITHYFFFILFICHASDNVNNNNIEPLTSFNSIHFLSKKTPLFQELCGSFEVFENRYLKIPPQDIIKKTDLIISYSTIMDILKKTYNCLKKEVESCHWNKNNINDNGSVSITRYEKAHLFPDNATLHITGDLHGSWQDLCKVLNYSEETESIFEEDSFVFKKKYAHIYKIFCGDYADSGVYGIETLITLFNAYIYNPKNVYLVRGNHENIFINKDYGLKSELEHKYRGFLVRKIISLLHKIYDLMPVALWVGFQDEDHEDSYKWSLVCHGGLHPYDYDILHLFEKAVNLEDNSSCKMVPELEKMKIGYISGYEWSDFSKDGTEDYFYSNENRGNAGFMCTEKATKKFMEQNSDQNHKWVKIFRAHQHSLSWDDDIMQEIIENGGVSLFWGKDNPIVFTLTVMPCTGFGVPKKTLYEDEQEHVHEEYYPGIIHTAYVKVTQDSITVIQLPNDNIPKWCKNIHKCFLNICKNDKNNIFYNKKCSDNLDEDKYSVNIPHTIYSCTW